MTVGMYFLLLAILFSGGSQAHNLGKLEFVTVVFRHGDRAPIEIYPTDPYRESTWPNGLGQLTDLGAKRALQHGAQLRKKYDNFLPKTYNVTDLLVNSTDYDRTIMTATQILKGLYGCSQPLPPVHSNIPPDELSCSNLQQKVDRIVENHSRLLEDAAYYAGQDSSMFNSVMLSDTLLIEKENGLQLPDWTDNYYYPLKILTQTVFQYYFKSCDTSSTFLRAMLRRMLSKVQGKESRKMWLYSCHDATLSSIQQCLGVSNGIRPEYLATLFFELYSNGKEYSVVISYKNSSDSPHFLKLEDCATSCPLNKFNRLVTEVFPNQWAEECHSEKMKFK